MNKKEINTMTDEELMVKADALLHPGNEFRHLNGKLVRIYPGRAEFDFVPDYLNDFSATWQLVEKAEEQNRGVMLMRNDKGMWEMAFSRELPELRRPGEKFIDMGNCTPDTSVYRAITKAFIIAMENEKDANL